jgi:ribosome maturation factor RimP
MKLEQPVQDQLAAIVADEGLELVTTEVVGSGSKTILRLVVDGPDGVNLDQCAVVSRQASVMLDVEDPFRHHYTLEVSSPGLDRKLYQNDDYERYVGHRVKIRMAPSFREPSSASWWERETMSFGFSTTPARRSSCRSTRSSRRASKWIGPRS